MPLASDSAPILLLTLRAGNIQTQGGWRVTNAIDAFSINDGELYLTVVNKPATFVATVYLTDNFQMLNEAYQNLTASAVITVEVMPGDLSVKWPSRLEVVAGGVYVFKAHGGFMPHTYTLLENPAANAFAFTNGTLSVNVSAAIEEYRFTVVVSDAVSMVVTAGGDGGGIGGVIIGGCAAIYGYCKCGDEFAHFCGKRRDWDKNLRLSGGWWWTFCGECRQWCSIFAGKRRRRVVYAHSASDG